MAMTAIVFRSDENSESDGGGTHLWLCVDKKVHLQSSKGWYNQAGAERSAFSCEDGECLDPCDGSCVQNTIQLPSEAEELVQRFLNSGGKEKGEIHKKAPLYSAEELAKIEAE